MPLVTYIRSRVIKVKIIYALGKRGVIESEV